MATMMRALSWLALKKRTCFAVAELLELIEQVAPESAIWTTSGGRNVWLGSADNEVIAWRQTGDVLYVIDM